MRKRSIKKLIAISFMIAVGLFLAVVPFQVPFTYYKYNSFIGAIKLGIDLKGGIVAVYEAELPEGSEADFDTSLDATITRLSDLLTSEGYTEATVVKQQGNRIRVEVPDVDNPSAIFDLIGTPAQLEIRKEESTDAEVFITGEHIKNITASYQDSQYGVVVEFTSEGKTLFADLTTDVAGSNLYIDIGGELYSSPTVNEAILNGVTFITGESMTTQTGAEEFAMKLLSGTFSVSLVLLDNSVISATLGANALEMGIIAGVIGFAIIMLFLILVYGVFGLLADMALMVYVVLLLFFLQAVPLVQLTLPGIAGILLSIGMAVDGNVVIFERIKDEYRLGKKIPAAVASGFKKGFSAILDANVTTIIAAVVLYLLGTSSIKGFAITLLLGIVISMFTTLVVTKYFIKVYLPINSSRPKPYKLTREDNVNENN